MSGKAPKQKGNRFEYKVRDILRSMGFQARRVDLSGAGKEKGDVVWSISPVMETIGQCKHERDGFARIYKLLKDHHWTAVKADGKEIIWSFHTDVLEAILNEVALQACEGMVQYGYSELGKPYGKTGDND